jgi:S-methylmethionine-dependent homocysteine/selenocysteine methylase
LVPLGVPWIGGYANTFTPVPPDWTLDGDNPTDGLLGLREDLDPERYAGHAAEWLAAGATVVGGCCGTRPAHIARMRPLLDQIRATRDD